MTLYSRGHDFLGYNEGVKDELAVCDESDSLGSLVAVAIKLDNRMRKRRREKTGRSQPLCPGHLVSTGRTSAPLITRNG